MKSATSPIPSVVGFVVDGNRRWARKRGLPPWEGYREGAQRVGEAIGWVRDAGVRSAIFYLFSTENWSRPHTERSRLFALCEEFLRDQAPSFRKEGIRVRVVGQIERFPPALRGAFARLENVWNDASETPQLEVYFCLSYGGRLEIVEAARRIAHTGEEITEASLAQSLWTAPLTDADLIIRTGGARRLSNFLLWQAAYAELYFTDTLWPDFSREEFAASMQWYARQERRFGK